MLKLEPLGTLDLRPEAGRAAHVSAASGLVRKEGGYFVIADDEHHLAIFDADFRQPGRLLRLIEGDLPTRPAARKARKPDFEALLSLPDGDLLVLGSGSTERRVRGVRITRGGAVRLLNLSPLYRPLAARFAALNIEGAVARGEELLLFQRGNSRHAENAIIRYRLEQAFAALASGAPLAPSAVIPFDLGTIAGVPLGFTDASALPDGRIVFSAVAENTADPYLDGACVGAAVGILSAELAVLRIERLEDPLKIEGIDARLDGDAIRLMLVSDADDPDIAAMLYAAIWRP